MDDSPRTLSFSDTCCPGMGVYPTVQINMKVLSNETWIKAIAEIARRWVKITEFQGSGTLWSVTQNSVDFGKPILAEFILPYCLPGFGEYLFRELTETAPDAAMTSPMFFLGHEVWKPFCHVREGEIWLESESKTAWVIAPESSAIYLAPMIEDDQPNE